MKTGTAVVIAACLALAIALEIYLVPRIGPTVTSAPTPAQIAGSVAPQPASPLASRRDASASDTTGSLGASGIVVVGTGTVQTAPDLAYVTVGTQSRGTTAKEAQDQNNATMTAVLASIKRLGIAEKDIQTLGLSLSPVYRNDGGTITGYDASNAVTVRVQDINQAGPILDSAVAAGANASVSIRFALRDPDGAYRQALGSAVADAQGKAAAIAKAMGVQIKAVQSTVEESTGPTAPLGMGDLAARSAGPAVPIQPGELTVTARLRITYSY